MDSWVAEELKGAFFGDTRRNRRLVKIVEDLAAQPNSSVPQASGNWGATAEPPTIFGRTGGWKRMT